MMKTLRPITTPLLRTSTLTPASPYRAASLTRPTNHNRTPLQTRAFLSNPFNGGGPQTISGTRTLPHPPHIIFPIICDVASYKHYYPFCLESTVTRTSAPAAADGKRYPEEAKLVIGWQDSGALREEFWSRIYCAPQLLVVEAVSGNSETTLAREEIGHHTPRPAREEDPTRRDGLLEHLLTRWTLRPQGEGTEVRLAIEFRFANPVYAALSQAAVPRVAEKIIEAFEKRVERVVGGKEAGR